MTPRIRAQRDQPILFAHRGASADAPENTLEAFGLALEMGADGLESDVWVSADGEPILVHDEQFGRRTRRRKIGDVARADLPPHMPTITDLFDSVGRDFELSLDIKDPPRHRARPRCAPAFRHDRPHMALSSRRRSSG